MSINIDFSNGQTMHDTGVLSLQPKIPGNIAKVTIRAWLPQGSLQLAGWTAIFVRQAMDILILVAVQSDAQLHILQL